ncbi:MAG: YjbQ family protein [Alphaproteobacteria bacterium]|nr:MAG: YjbQ family protein [Alphaproteobacteria bacterium]
MKQSQGVLTVQTDGPGLYEFSEDAVNWCLDQDINTGLLTIYIRHTSASLTIQENADPDVLHDLQAAFDRFAPKTGPYLHTAEGPDDMPAHIKSALTQTHLSIPVDGGRPLLGTWQGLFVFEHRNRPHDRYVVLHLSGE